MTQDKPNPASAAARTGSGKHHKRLASEVPGLTPPARHAQDKNCVVRNGPQLRRLVPPAPPARPRRIEVRIAARDGPAPVGRTRTLHLTRDDLDELIDHALQLEAARR